MSTKRASAAFAAALVPATAAGILHDHAVIAIALGAVTLLVFLYGVVELLRPTGQKPPMQSGGAGGPGGSASVGNGVAMGGRGGRGGDVIGAKDG
ncbi:MAG TPA: hypothetical protein VF730_06200 [Terracidiphilus sp.]